MNYEIAVLAALVQLNKPTRPKISEITGISTQRINSSIKNLKLILDIGIHWHGAKKTGHYQIESWGSFERGKNIRRKMSALKLDTYRQKKEIEYDSALIKKIYAKEMSLHNYRHSLELEGFKASDSLKNLEQLSTLDRIALRNQLKKQFTRQKPSLSGG